MIDLLEVAFMTEMMKIIFKHIQITLHGFVYRKCGPNDVKSCDYCKSNPPRGSEKLWSALPDRAKNGALFYDCEEDMNNPGHYRPLLDLIQHVKDITIKLVRMFSDVSYCKVPLLLFKNLILICFLVGK